MANMEYVNEPSQLYAPFDTYLEIKYHIQTDNKTPVIVQKSIENI